jgi:hypothetical protein
MSDQDPVAHGQRLPREAAVRRLMVLDADGQLGSEHVLLAAEGLAVSVRTVWRWLERARATGDVDRPPRGHFEVTDQVLQRLAYWRGNIAAVHRELLEAERNEGTPAPSRQTLQRAVERDVLRGDRAGLRHGERARRAHDVFLKRPRTYRNEAWESDHVEAPVEVDVEGRLLKPWVTWFVDVDTNAVCGTAITPGPASRESILAALRAAITMEAPGREEQWNEKSRYRAAGRRCVFPEVISAGCDPLWSVFPEVIGRPPVAGEVCFGSRHGDLLAMWAIFEQAGEDTTGTHTLTESRQVQLNETTSELVEAFQIHGLHWES